MACRTVPVRFVLAFSLAVAVGVAQQSAKRPISHKDYDSWKSITNQAISKDGRYLAYAIFPQAGDGELVLRDLQTGSEKRHAIGALPPPPDPAESAGDEPPRPVGVRIAFTGDLKFVVSTAFPPKAETDKAKKERRRPEAMPKNGIVMLATSGDAAYDVPNVKSVQVPETGPAVIAFLKEGAPETGETRSAAPKYGTDLVVRDLRQSAPADRTIADITDYAFAKDGRTLAYAVSSKSEDKNGMFAIAAPDGAPVALAAGKGKYAKPVWDRAQKQLAFLGAPSPAEKQPSRFRLYLWDRKADAAAELVGTSTPGFRQGYAIYDRGSVSFSRDGSRVFVSVAPEATVDRPPEPPAQRQATAPANDDKPVADLWSWKDDYVQPMQKVRLNRERNRSYMAAYHIAEKKFVQLADPDLATIVPNDDGRYALGANDRPYRSMVDFDAAYADYFLVNTITGERKELLKKQLGGDARANAPLWSPDGKFVLYYRKGQWHAVSVPGGEDTNLTAKLGLKFEDEEHDTPNEAGPYGTAGWTKDGKVLVYDRFDVWEIDPANGAARNITAGVGRKSNLQFRVVRLDRTDDDDERGIDTAKPLALRAENLATRDSGIWELKAGSPPVQKVMGAKNYRPLLKAKEADVVIATATTFRDDADLLVTDSSYREFRKVTDANPHKAGMLWGTAEMVRYENVDGVPLQGVLYKPDNFDPSRKYPMIVYIYERLSQNLHNFVAPRPGHSINISYYVSNGYLVLTPDIVYSVGAPGPSALKCVLPAVQAVVNKGFVNEQAIGIQGHSWGGYQIAYMVTQTNRFRAAEAGAPVANMISAYNGIRWGTGLPRQFQYEHTQSRIGGSPWQYPLRFIENSPVFHVDRVQTPMLLLHNDGDDAVPWYQGIEYFLSLRRLGKEAYLFNYNGEPHGLRKRPNQKDFTVRMQQFFDHFLKGAPAPEWMEKGIPYIDRETEKERFGQPSTDTGATP